MQSFTDPLVGIPRILLMLLLCQIIYWNIKSHFDVIQLLKIILFCYIIGALSLYYQVYYGPISWLGDTSMRGGILRYKSILGSITIFGSINGYAVVLLLSELSLVKNKLFKMILCIILIGASFISLQKSAMVMLPISFLLLLYYNIKFSRLKIKIIRMYYVILFILLFVVLIKYNPTIESYYNAAVTTSYGSNIYFADSSEVLVDTHSLNSPKDILNRLYGFITAGINMYGPISYFGIGMLGGAGTMGMKADITAHNTLGDLLFMGGIIYVIIFLILFVNIQLYLYRDIRNHLSSTFFMCNILFFVNMIFTSGTLIQPSISIVFWLSVAYVAQKSKILRKYTISY